MCIINRKAEVSNTKILVSPNHDGTRQLVVYENRVENLSGQSNAMILPCPNPESIQLHDLTKYKTIFKDCDVVFPSDNYFSNSRGSKGIAKGKRKLNTLAVVDCGSYRVTIVPSLAQFEIVDAKEFKLEPGTANLLAKYYSQGFGFLVCRLKDDVKSSSAATLSREDENEDEETKDKYHPFAYSHTLANHEMFVPTRHHHSGEEEETMSHYDHSIYSVNTTALAGNSFFSTPIEFKPIANWTFPAISTFYRFKIKRNDLNCDLRLKLLSSPDNQVGTYFGVDGCVFKTNTNDITFKNVGSIYIEPVFRNCYFYAGAQQPEPMCFAGPGTHFQVSLKNPNLVHVRDDVGLKGETLTEYEFKVGAGVYPTKA